MTGQSQAAKQVPCEKGKLKRQKKTTSFEIYPPTLKFSLFITSRFENFIGCG